MTTHVALLRGINVAGKTVAMADLERIFASLGFQDIQIYIRTGNLVFTSSEDSENALTEMIENGLHEDLGHDIRVLLRSPNELRDLVDRNPFLRRVADPTKLHVTFLATAPRDDLARKIVPDIAPPDEFEIAGRNLYLHCPEGYGRSKLGNAFWERKLKAVATTRNWNTLTTLATMATEV